MLPKSFATRSIERFGRRTISALIAGTLALTACAAYGQQPLTMAPPIQAYSGPGTAPTDGAAGSVFNWQEIPANQNVPIQRAIFDKGGYQLYDTVGETIVVPFTNENLYVMQFAVSDDGSTYFVNTGSTPVLYLPEDGYLENASDAGARWYPFTQQWHPSQPVYIGIAPTWNDYVAMGWYPNMAYFGGYWSRRPFVSVGLFTPTVGLLFQIGGQRYSDWDSYRGYYQDNPAPYHITIVNRNFYRWGGRNWQQYAGADHPFNGAGRPYVYGQGFVANTRHTFVGGGHPSNSWTAPNSNRPVGNGFRGATPAPANHQNQGPSGWRAGQSNGASAPQAGRVFHGASGAPKAAAGSSGSPKQNHGNQSQKQNWKANPQSSK